jgi:Tfp pilus assembly protein PilF
VALAATVVLAGCGIFDNHGSTPSVQAAAAGAASTAASSGAGLRTAATTIASLLQVGIGQAQQQNWTAATTTFNDVLALSPGNVYALYNLGLVAQTTGDNASADNYYRQAIKSNATYTPAMYNLAITLEKSQAAQAIDLYKQIVVINPKASTAYLRLAFVYAQQGQEQAAKAAQAQAIAIDPTLGKYPLPAQG